MGNYLIWRLVKFVALALFAGGLGATLGAQDRLARVRRTWSLVFPGFLLLWVSGWMMMKLLGSSPAEPWIIATMLTSGMALDGAFRSGHKQTPGRQASLMGLGGLFGSVGLMVARPTDAVALVGLIVGGMVLGLLATLAFSAGPPTDGPADRAEIQRGFAVVAWAEGISFVVLMIISLPLRLFADIDLDGDTGLLGWIHGVMVIVYIQSLWSVRDALGWSWTRFAIGFIAAMLPFGSFVFERRVARG